VVESRIGSVENAKYLAHLTMDDEFGGTCGSERTENTYRSLFGEPEEKRIFGRHKLIGKDDIEVGFKIRMGKRWNVLICQRMERVAAFV